MSFLSGVTSFLESVDQKAAVMSGGGGGRHSPPVPVHDAPFSAASRDADPTNAPRFPATPSTASTDSLVIGGATSSATASGSSSSVSAAEYAATVQSLLEAQQQAERRYEAAIAERAAAFQALEASYQTLTDFSQSQTAKLVAVADDLLKVEHERDAAMRREAALSASVTQYDAAVAALRHEVATLQHEHSATAQQRDLLAEEQRGAREGRRRAEELLQSLSAEFADYKKKTRAVLEEKEALLNAAHKRATIAITNGTAPDSMADVPSTFRLEMERLRSVNDALQQECEAASHASAEWEREVRSLQQQRARLEGHLTAAEAQSHELQTRLKAETDVLEQQYEAERAAHAETRRMLNAQQQELLDLQRRHGPSSSLPQGGSGGGVGSSAGTSTELCVMEQRVRELGDALMEKQSALEAKRGEADQWRTRYEVAQQRLREAELLQSALHSSASSATASSSSHRLNANNANTRVVYVDPAAAGGGGGDDDVSKHRWMRTLSRRGGGFGEGVVTAARGIDRVSLQAGSVLRHHSLLRVGLIVYVLLLHLWVFVAVTMSGQMPSGDGRGGASSIGPK